MGVSGGCESHRRWQRLRTSGDNRWVHVTGLSGGEGTVAAVMGDGHGVGQHVGERWDDAERQLLGVGVLLLRVVGCV